MLPIIFAIMVILIVVYFLWIRRPKNDKQLFVKRCHGLLDSKYASADIASIVKRLILLVDTQNTLKYPESRGELEDIYADAKTTKCYEDLKEDINRLFDSASLILNHR